MSKSKKQLNIIITNSIEIGNDCTQSWKDKQDLKTAKVGLSAYRIAIKAIKQTRDLL